MSTEYLKSNSKLKRFCRDDVLIRDGAQDTEMYFIIQGSVGVYKNYGEPNQVQVAGLKAGDFFGEMNAFLNKHRTATIVAHSEVLALELTQNNAFLFFQEEPELIFKFIRTLCGRLDHVNNLYLETCAKLEAGAPTQQEASPTQSTPPVPKASLQKPIPENALFPKGHKRYTLPEAEINPRMISRTSYACPLCDHEFKAVALRTTNMKLVSTDNDLRKHYDGIEPLHYMTLTCPRCWFSAIRSNFEKTLKGNVNTQNMMKAKLRNYQQELGLDFQADITADGIFTSLYLATICVPMTGRDWLLSAARLWLNISWMYTDCEDKEMETFATGMALEAYQKAYQEVEMDEKTLQSMSIILGELHYKTGNVSDARKFLNSARLNKQGTPVMSRFAENRLIDLKQS